jgi:FkbM family methyltransferase
MMLAASIYPSLQSVAVEIDGCGLMTLDLRESVCTQLFKYGYYPHQLGADHLVRQIVGAGAVVFDIGANIGWYSCLIDTVAQGQIRVVAVEPAPRAVCLLTKNASHRNIEVIACAIGEASGSADLVERSTLDLAQVRFCKSGKIRVVTIDDLATRFGQPQLIKIDVEGAEMLAIRGALKTLRHREPPYVLFEYISANTFMFGGYPLTELVELFREAGYSVLRIARTGQTAPLDSTADPAVLTNDYLAVPPGYDVARMSTRRP